MPVDLLELDPASREYKAPIALLARRHGARLAQAADLLQRVFLLRSDWAPGLRFVGAQARARYLAGKSQLMSVGGCALSLEDAFASCLGEAAERLSQVERAGDVKLTASLSEVEGRVSDAAEQLARRVLEQSGRPEHEKADWLAGVSLDGVQTLVAADWCIRRADAGPLTVPGAALSVGCAAGPDVAEARERALLELVERDAVSLWWDGGRPGSAVSWDLLPSASNLLAGLRASSDARRTSLIDLTTELKIPVVAAWSTDRDKRSFVCGFAARASLDAAADAALMEMCQLEIGLQLAALKREQLGEAALDDVDRSHLLRAEQIDVAADLRLAAARPSGRWAPGSGTSEVSVVQMLERAGIEASLVDLGRPDIGIAVVKAVAPALQLSPSRLQTARLRAAVEAHAPSPAPIGLF